MQLEEDVGPNADYEDQVERRDALESSADLVLSGSEKPSVSMSNVECDESRSLCSSTRGNDEFWPKDDDPRTQRSIKAWQDKYGNERASISESIREHAGEINCLS